MPCILTSSKVLLNTKNRTWINQVSFTISFSVKYGDYNSADYANPLQYDTLECGELKQSDKYHFVVPVIDLLKGNIIASCHLEVTRTRIGGNTSSSEGAH